jgi:hypothetical protein
MSDGIDMRQYGYKPVLTGVDWLVSKTGTAHAFEEGASKSICGLVKRSSCRPVEDWYEEAALFAAGGSRCCRCDDKA